MKEKKVRFSCPLDCFDLCSLVATVVDERVVQVEGDKQHPLTKGYTCEKGKKHLERMYHPERIVKPKKRVGDHWEEMTWEEAIDEIGERLLDIRKKHGSTAVMHCYDSGYGGLSKTADEMFFNYFGGVTVPRGSLCWGAGIAAQKYDFGDARGHMPQDLLHSKLIILWGRNPAHTNLHLMEYLTKAKKQGVEIILIDPIKTKTAQIATEHVGVRPATDGALALGMAHVILQEGWIDEAFIQNHTLGFEDFQEYVADFSPKRVEEITGIDQEKIRHLARRYALSKPSSIIIGYGMQRYANGGNNVRCIDALGAITGNIGIPGGGVNYANKGISSYIGGELLKSEQYVKHQRSYSRTKLGEFLEKENDPSIQCIFVTKTNPLVQTPHIHKTMKAFEQVPFKVVIDMFMTDTAKLADVVLPCTSVLEEEDIMYTSMFSPYLNYSHRVVKPPEGVMGEYEFFKALAQKINLKDYPDIEQEEFLKRGVAPLEEAFGVDFETLKNSSFMIPDREIPWKNGQFKTPSGKFEFYSQKALEDGLSPLPQYIPPMQGEVKYPLRLITPHSRGSLHSQHFVFTEEMPTAYMNSKTFEKYGLAEGKLAKVQSKQGELNVKVAIDEGVGDELVMIYEGWWHKSGSVNLLTDDGISDMGEQAAYYDCFCRIDTIEY